MQNINDEKFSRLEQSIEEIKGTLGKVEEAIVGSLNKSSGPGLIEETRSLRKDVIEIQARVQQNTQNVAECIAFRKSVKKAVAFITICVPFLAEGLKFVLISVWDFVKFKS